MYIHTVPAYSLSVPQYYNVHTNVSGLHSGRRILDITPPTLSISHTSTVPIVAVGKKWRTNMDHSGFLNRQTPYSNYFEVAGGLSAVNAFGTQLRDLIDVGFTQLLTDRWTPSRKAGGIPCVSTRYCLGGDNERASAGRTPNPSRESKFSGTHLERAKTGFLFS